MVDQITPEELKGWFAETAGQPVVLDVREGWELEAASVKPNGFDLVAIPMGHVPARIGELDPARPVAVLCHHGARSQRVAVFLAQQGFERVANVAGGIEAWSGHDPGVPRY
jgi:rhodanese-related sulfurtransferase